MKYNDEKRKTYILLSLQFALLGEISPNVRAIFVDWNSSTITLYFIFDGELSEEDKENASCIETEFSCCLPIEEEQIRYTTNCIRIDAPKPIPQFGRECVYKRKEQYER